MNKKIIIYASIIILTAGLVFLANGLVLAWDWPTSNPTGGNVPPPLADPTGKAMFNSNGRLDINGGTEEYWIGKDGNSFALYNGYIQAKKRMILGQDGFFEIKGGGATAENTLFSVDTGGNIKARDRVTGTFFEDSQNPSYLADPAGISIMHKITMDDMSFAGQSGKICMFFSRNTCPAGWTNKGVSAFFTYKNACPYTLGNQFTNSDYPTSFYWCFAQLCCAP